METSTNRIEKAEWKFWHFKGDPQKVMEELKTLGYGIKPDEMVEYARTHPDSELHKCYTWDDTEAARKWRLQESRMIQANLQVHLKKPDMAEPIVVRFAYTNDLNKRGYKETVRILQNKDEYFQMMQVAYGELQSYVRKYNTLMNARMIESMDSVMEEFKGMMQERRMEEAV